MAKVIKCDICGKECKEYAMYTLLEHRLILGSRKNDICYDCIDRIKEEIKAGKE